MQTLENRAQRVIQTGLRFARDAFRGYSDKDNASDVLLSTGGEITDQDREFYRMYRTDRVARPHTILLPTRYSTEEGSRITSEGIKAISDESERLNSLPHWRFDEEVREGARERLAERNFKPKAL